MKKNNFLGNYLPGHSFIHRLDPRIKFLSLFWAMLISFYVDRLWSMGILLAFVWGLVLLSQIGWRAILTSLKPTLAFICLVLFINFFFLQSGKVWLDLGIFCITEGAVTQTLIVIFRIILMVLMSFLLTSTTRTSQITLAVSSLLQPLKAINFPVHETSMILALSLRFIPTFLSTSFRLMDAQGLRGAKFRHGSLHERIKAFISLIVPLFVKAFQHADVLAMALEVRFYDPQKPRTNYQSLHLSPWDYVMILSFVGVTLVVVWCNHALL